MFCSAYTDCYILYRATRYLIAFLGIFIFVGCVAVGTVFADLRIKKETARKKSNCFSSILLHRGYNPNQPHVVHNPQEVFRWSPIQIASETHCSWSVTFLHWSKNGNFFSKVMLVWKPALRLCFFPFTQRNVLPFWGFFKVRMGERSVRIREVKGSNPSRSTFSSSVILTLLLFFCVHISQTLALGPGGIRTARPCRRQGKQSAQWAVASCAGPNQ